MRRQHRVPERKWSASFRLLLGAFCFALLAPTASARPSEPGLEVCHVPPGRPEHTKVLQTRSEGALVAHLDHGDRIFGIGLDADCIAELGITLDETLVPDTTELSGLADAPPRPVAVLLGPDGRTDEYVVGEIEIKPANATELQAFLTRYAGVIVRDDLVQIRTDDGTLELRPGGGWYLVRIDPQASDLFDLPGLLADAGVQGTFSFSSEQAARTLAALLRERALRRTPNLVLEPHVVPEHPLVQNPDPSNPFHFIDFSRRWWMTEDDDLTTPEEDGLSIGVVRAWEYLRHTGLPPVDGVWEPARIAIIDSGFNLSDATGVGGQDYPFNPPPQLDLVDFDGTAEGPAPGPNPWHGENSFGVCCARPRNLFGGAGIGGEFVRPIPIKATLGWADLAGAVRAAWLMEADVINLSVGGQCNWLCDVGDFFVESHLQEEILNATTFGSAVFASAGNGPDNMTRNVNTGHGDWTPCEMSHVTCVGAIDSVGDNVWNWGENVDIWAPTNIRSTVTPLSAATDGDDFGLDELKNYGGTSCASPFAAGVAGLLKTAAPTLPWDEVERVLQQTSNASSDFRVSEGYVDALRAVQAVRANPAPTASFIDPLDGDRRSWAQSIPFVVALADPPAPGGFEGEVTIESSLDGEICTEPTDSNVLICDQQLTTLGVHEVVVTATDTFGAVSVPDTIQLEIVNQAPTVTLVSPTDGSTVFSDQNVSYRAQISDLDMESYTVLCQFRFPGEACIEWTSDLDGLITPLAGGVTNFIGPPLSVGTHQIRVTVIDGQDVSDSQTAVVTVLAGVGKPTASIRQLRREDGTIVTPDNNTVLAGTRLFLFGEGSDPEDGVLDGASLAWSSDEDGPLGTGRNVEATLSGPPPGVEGFIPHTITLQATDSDGNTASDAFQVFVGRIL